MPIKIFYQKKIDGFKAIDFPGIVSYDFG